MDLKIKVPDELVGEVSAWEDGASYTLTVTQTGKGSFDLVAGELSEPSEPSAPESMEEATAAFNEE